jgi:PP-loop superfamily ATP-utilizing enzyme
MKPLCQALTAILGRLPDAPVALSGGLDSWVLALLLRQMGRPVRGYSLVSGIAGYCEWEQVSALSKQFSVDVEPIPAPDFEGALPRFLAVTRTPIYNLHPVSKLLLAEGLAARGVAAVFTGDGADQVFRMEDECDLRPLTEACFQQAGVALLTPFLAPEIRALCTTPDPEKRPLRALAESLGVPPIPKRPTYYPGADILQRTTQMLEANVCAASLG